MSELENIEKYDKWLDRIFFTVIVCAYIVILLMGIYVGVFT